MPILNYTTKIDAFKTISQIQQILMKAGCNKIVIDSVDGMPVGLSFVLTHRGNNIAFAMPCRFQGVLKRLKSDKRIPRSLCTDEQAIRVGWRILLNWIEAQMAMVEAETASLAEIFLTWAVTNSGETVSEKLLEKNDSKGFFLLPSQS